MTRRIKLRLTIEVEVNDLDERVHHADLRWGLRRAFETNDGRQPLSTEIFFRGMGEVAEQVALTAQDIMGSRIAQRYSGARLRPYEIHKRVKARPRAWWARVRGAEIREVETVRDEDGRLVEVVDERVLVRMTGDEL